MCLSKRVNIYIAICTDTWINRRIYVTRRCDLSFTLLMITVLELPFTVYTVAVSETAKRDCLLPFALTLALCLSWCSVEKQLHEVLEENRSSLRNPRWVKQYLEAFVVLQLRWLSKKSFWQKNNVLTSLETKRDEELHFWRRLILS